MDLGIGNRVALVCASSKGIGKGCAAALAAEGVRLAMCARDKDVLSAAAEEIRSTTRAEILTVPADVTSEHDLDMLFESVKTHFGTIDILVTNTGGPKVGSFELLGDDDWVTAFRLIHLSTIGLIRRALPDMRAVGWGRIIAIQSSSVKQPVEMLTLSNALRPGIAGLLKSLMHDVARNGITVNTVLPGVILTDRILDAQQTRAEASGRTLEAQLGLLAERIPIGRFGSPEDIGNLVAFLASDRARYITGAVLQVDGGLIQSVV